MIKIEIKFIGNDGPVFPNNVNSKCPAIIFAASRTAKVPGRIMFLIVSINTMNDISAGGVPWGTKWENIWFVWLIHPNSINLNHIGSAIVNVNAKCLVLVKIYGNNPMKLLNIIIIKIEMKMNVVPLNDLGPSNVLNSLCKVKFILFHIMLIRDDINQNIDGINSNPMNVLVQFNEILKILVDGSKVENRFVIIFKFDSFFLLFSFLHF